MQQYYANILLYKLQEKFFKVRGNKALKKKLLATILAVLVLSEFAPMVLAVKNTKTNEPKKMSISKTHKLRQKSDEFKYEYINYEWWNNFNDPILTGYIDKAIKNNYSLKMATIAVDEYYQAIKIQFANELPQAMAGFSPAYLKNSGFNNADWSFALPALVNYEADIFLKNHDKTKAAKRIRTIFTG